ncbi:MAG: hypothetical protein A3F09_05855 [Chlamydiae bacterium RIFCSPHIGHO2_12_FULL_49_11]|nr:MAG: hypothetical protein A3F09_05855 [Chlamydiae bacterium RIFCSPHIGHO2_12_FULL_49_11]
MKHNDTPIPLEGMPILTAHEMARIEQRAIAEDPSLDELFMETASRGMFELVLGTIRQKDFSDHAILVCGKGNNAGDAYTIGTLLLAESIEVDAYQLFPLDECSKLCRKHAAAFKSRGGVIHTIARPEEMEIPSRRDIIIDGIVGTGFTGTLTGLASDIVQKINRSENCVFAIDIPSGIHGGTGEIGEAAIEANITAYLGALKIGHLYNQGLENVGDLYHIDFGLETRFYDGAHFFGHVINPEILRHNLHKPRRKAHKYEVGQVAVVAGSPNMPGAAVLAANAALRSGAGMVKVFSSPEAISKMHGLFPEVILIPMEPEALQNEMHRTRSLVVGPGLSRTKEAEQLVHHIFKLNAMKVIDGDALYFMTDKPPPRSILTPHEGELRRLLHAEPEVGQLELVDLAQNYVDRHDVILVYKGAPTTLFAKGLPKLVFPFGNQGMAKAGMGDVLAGMIGAFLLFHDDLREAAAMGTLLHQRAGDHVQARSSIHSLIASDLIADLGPLFHHLEK